MSTYDDTVSSRSYVERPRQDLTHHYLAKPEKQ
jgi:hypothetical protein